MIENDNLSKSLVGLIPARFKDTDEFLDIVSWNLAWFNANEPKRVKQITEILAALNSDLFVFEEISHGSLETVAAELKKEKAGDYKIYYGTTGGDQRVTFMYDFDWLRAKDDFKELFGKGVIKSDDKKDAFPRLPLWGYFLCKSIQAMGRGFDFQIVGLHLKSQMGGGSPQRQKACETLADWLKNESSLLDSDAILMGDFNSKPSSTDWNALHDLERAGDVQFEAINDETDYSHLYYENKNKIGSRLDIAVVTYDAAKKLNGKQAQTIRWITLDELLEQNPKAGRIKNYISDIKKNVTDHMPLFTRYYLNSN